MKEIYSQEITGPSMDELSELAFWYNKILGNHPIIVGGWAAHIYTGGLGSKDIDIVFPDDKSKHATLSVYFATHGYVEKRTGLFDVELVKIVRIGSREIEIIIDAVSAKREIRIKGGKVLIPWSWAQKDCIEKKVGEATVMVPSVETLLAYKLGAVLGRNEKLRQETSQAQAQYLRSKVWKDVYDVLGLSGLELDGQKVKKRLEESGLGRYGEEIMQIIEENYDGEMKDILKGIETSKIRGILI